MGIKCKRSLAETENEPNPNSTISVLFELVPVLSFEKSFYIINQEHSFLSDRLLVELWSKSMITNPQNTKIRLVLTIFVGPNRTFGVRIDPKRSRTEILKTESDRTEPEPEPDFKNSVEPNSNRKISVRFGL